MRYFYNQTSNPLNYITCGNLISQDGFVHLRRNFNVNVLILVQEGVLYISQNGVHHCIGPNEYLLLRAGEEHFGYQPSKGRVSYLWVHFTMIESDLRIVDDSDLDSLITVMLNTPANHQFLLPECGNIALTKRAPLLFRQLMDLSHQDMLYSPLILDYALSLLIMELTQELIEMHFHIKNNVPPVIAQIMEWIKINYYRQITVSDVAFEFGYNPDYLSSLFHKTIGMTLMQYIRKTRIDISKTLLSNYDLSIKQAAFSCGFTDEKYYMKTFRILEGMTPSQYKKAFSKKRLNEQK